MESSEPSTSFTMRKVTLNIRYMVLAILIPFIIILLISFLVFIGITVFRSPRNHEKSLLSHDSSESMVSNYNVVSKDYECKGCCYCDGELDEYCSNLGKYETMVISSISTIGATSTCVDIFEAKCENDMEFKCPKTYKADVRGAKFISETSVSPLDEVDPSTKKMRIWCEGKCSAREFKKKRKNKAAIQFDCPQYWVGSAQEFTFEEAGDIENDPKGLKKLSDRYYATEVLTFCETMGVSKYWGVTFQGSLCDAKISETFCELM